MWQPNRTREIVKREELRQERERSAENGLEHARDLDADEVERRAEHRRRESEATGSGRAKPDRGDPARDMGGAQG